MDQAAAIGDPSAALWQEAVTQVDVELLMFGEADANGFRPVIVAMRQDLPPEAPLERYLDDNMSKSSDPHGHYGIEFESEAEDEVRAIATSYDYEDGAIQWSAYWVIRRAGSSVFSVSYQANHPVFAGLEPLFRASAETIALKQP
jgi:hypothetical protein